MKEDQQQNLLKYLQNHLPCESPLSLKKLTGGVSNLTYRISDDKDNWIARTSPAGSKAKGAHDMVREYQILKALQADYALSPKPQLLIEDTTIFPRPLYVMEAKEGIAIQQKIPDIYTEVQLPDLCHSLINAQHRLHQVPLSNDLEKFNKGRGYIERQISGWIKRLQRVLPNHDKADYISQWLRQNQPKDERDYVLIHNDFKFDNVFFNHQNSTEVNAVLDWEMATVGDPLMDLGASLAYWFQADDAPAMQAISTQPTTHPNMLSRDQYVDHYCRLSGLELDNYDFYYAFGLYRLVVIIQQIYYRYEQGQTQDPRFKPFGQIRDLLISHTLQQIGDKHV